MVWLHENLFDFVYCCAKCLRYAISFMPSEAKKKMCIFISLFFSNCFNWHPIYYTKLKMTSININVLHAFFSLFFLLVDDVYFISTVHCAHFIGLLKLTLNIVDMHVCRCNYELFCCFGLSSFHSSTLFKFEAILA